MSLEQHLHVITLLLNDLMHIIVQETHYIKERKTEALQEIQIPKKILIEKLLPEKEWMMENKENLEKTLPIQREKVKKALHDLLPCFQKYEKTIEAAHAMNALHYEALSFALRKNVKNKGKYNAKGKKERGDSKDLSFTLKAEA